MEQHAAYFSPQVAKARRFFRGQADHDSPFPAEGSLEVIAGGCEWCAAHFLVERETLPYHAMEYLREGAGRVRLGDTEHSLRPGMAYFFDPDLPHRIEGDPAAPMVKYFFNFSGSRIETLWSELGIGPGTVLTAGEPSRFTQLLDEAIDHALKDTPLGRRACASALEHAMVVLVESAQTQSAGGDAAFATYLRCRNYLLRHCAALTSIQAAADGCGISSAYFCRLFQRYDRETPHECLRRLRMHQALQNLREPGAQVKAVAANLGFKSAAHFSRSFKSVHGHAPRRTPG